MKNLFQAIKPLVVFVPLLLSIWMITSLCKLSLRNFIAKRIGHYVKSQESALAQRRKEILRVILSPFVYTLKRISENQVNQNNVPCVASQTIQKINAPLYRLKPTTLSLCYILCTLKNIVVRFQI